MRTLSLAFSPRFITLTLVSAVALCLAAWIAARPWDGAWRLVPLLLFGWLTAVGVRDLFNTSHAVLRNYPLAAHIRFILEGMSGRWSINGPKWFWTSGRSAPSSICITAGMNG
jgi:hypothetical protein